MLSNKILEYLSKNKILKHNINITKDFRKVLKEYGFNNEINSSFIQFMSIYGDEFSGSIGTIINLAEDLIYKEESNNNYLKSQYNIPNQYFQIFISEYDDYLLYNKEDDSVVLIEGGNDTKLKNEEFDQKWDSFNEFLEHFFELN